MNHWNSFTCQFFILSPAEICQKNLFYLVWLKLPDKFSFLYAFVQALWGEAGTPGSEH